MDYERQDKPAESPLERIKHFNEFHTPLSKEEQEHAVWRAEFRSVSLESRLQEWPVDVHCTTLCQSGMT